LTARASPHIPFLDQPSGTVTFMFTDIQGSTQLLYSLRERYATLLNDQRRILRKAFSNWEGYEVDTQGDAFFVAFFRATQAVSAAVEAQRKLAEHAWPENVGVRVRMGIHTGEPWNEETGYVGMDVHRAARIANVGHGGQVLLSESASALVQDELPPGVSLLDLGCHSLKDIRRPERIYQLVIEGLPAEFPPLKSQKALSLAKKCLGVLEILQSKDPTRIYERIDIINPVTHLGRKADNDLSFPKDSSVSRHHAIIKVRDGKVFLGEVVETHDDTGQPSRPTYGTFINGLQVQEPVELQDGDDLTLGTSLRIRFEAVQIKPDRIKGTQGHVDPCADFTTTIIPKTKDAPPSTAEIVWKIARIGNKMPTSTEVKELIARIKSKSAASSPQDKPESHEDT
jgi:class 3 adenylate cyclase/pSer/pThr/pTyr-binding forkhead associated (FHA) protein